MFSEDDHPRAGKGTTTGGEFVKAGTSSSTSQSSHHASHGRRPARRRQVRQAPHDPRAHAQHMAHEAHMAHVEHEHHARAVKDLQRLLTSLGLGDLKADGHYGDDTRAAVRRVQRKLGMPADGELTGDLLRRLRDAEALKPPCGDTKRAEVDDLMDSLMRAVEEDDDAVRGYNVRNPRGTRIGGRFSGDPVLQAIAEKVADALEEAAAPDDGSDDGPDADVDDEDATMDGSDVDMMMPPKRRMMATARARDTNADEPYGPTSEAHYADPGYQADGKKRYPLSSEEKCRAAWSYINMPKNAAAYTADQLASIKKRIKAAAKKYGIEIADADRAKMTLGGAGEILRYSRTWALDDIEIQRGGDGRTVEAYAAIFDTPTEIRDQHGHYNEIIHRAAFNRTLSHGIDRIGVYYHHGMTIHGTPSDLGSVPIGKPLDVRADGKGLRTVTRYNKSQLADSVLESIRNGEIAGYSFKGRIIQSSPSVSRSGGLPTITRTELGLSEYGPTPTPYYADAKILAVRSAQVVAAEIASLDDEMKDELIRILSGATHDDSAPVTPTPDMGLGAEDPHEEIVHSGRRTQTDIARRIARARLLLTGGINQ